MGRSRKNKDSKAPKGKAQKSEKDSSGFVGTLRRAAQRLTLGRERQNKVEAVLAEEGQDTEQVHAETDMGMPSIVPVVEPTPVPQDQVHGEQLSSDLLAPVAEEPCCVEHTEQLTGEQLNARTEQLRARLNLSKQKLQETNQLIAGLRVDLSKLNACTDKTGEERVYSVNFLKSYLPQAKEQLEAERDDYINTWEKVKEHLNKDFDDELKLGMRVITQTETPVPTDILEPLNLEQYCGWKSHLATLQEQLKNLKYRIAAKVSFRRVAAKFARFGASRKHYDGAQTHNAVHKSVSTL